MVIFPQTKMEIIGRLLADFPIIKIIIYHDGRCEIGGSFAEQSFKKALALIGDN